LGSQATLADFSLHRLHPAHLVQCGTVTLITTQLLPHRFCTAADTPSAP
jgi:hypothetical protein